MAELALPMAKTVLEQLGSLVQEEIILTWGIKSELKSLERTMANIEKVLKDAEVKQAQNQRLSTWLRQLKDVFFDAEDVLDEFECERLKRQVVETYGSIGRKVRRFFSRSNPLVFRSRIGHKVKDIRKSLAQIVVDRALFHPTTQSEENPSIKYATHSFVPSSEVVGREAEKEQIIALLKEQNDHGLNISVIPICGIGGLGKTTLAKLVYSDESVKSHFDVRLWVRVSQDFAIPKLFEEMLSSATGRRPENFTDDQVQENLRNHLRDQKFLLVLDDVWNESRDKWIELRNFLMEGAPGSKIIVTTRKDSVANIMGTGDNYNLKALAEGDCLSLFKRYAFKEGQEERHRHLVKIGEQIVENCKGVPLAVRMLGSLLFLKLDEKEWKYIRDNEIWKLRQDQENQVLAALELSYNDLPSHLKQCFLYCSLSPKEDTLHTTRLISLWVAHGVLHQSADHRNKSLEEIGNQYFDELRSRSFIQDEAWEGVVLYRMHHLIHDLACSIAKDECSIITGPTEEITQSVRHLSITYSCTPEILTCLDKLNNLRTIVFPEYKIGPSKTFFHDHRHYTPKFKYLRFLDLNYASFNELPSYIGNMKHLRYLNLSFNSEITQLPDSICKLQSLQVLLLCGCKKLEGLPKDIKHLISLRNLGITTTETCFRRYHFTTLRELDITDCEKLTSLPNSFRSLTALEILFIKSCNNLILTDNEEEESSEVNSYKLSIRKLFFWDLPKMVAIPRWLQWCASTLKVLSLTDCPNLTSLPRWLQDATSLVTIEILKCPMLSSLPDGIRNLTSPPLKLLINNCPGLKTFIQASQHNWEHLEITIAEGLEFPPASFLE